MVAMVPMLLDHRYVPDRRETFLHPGQYTDPYRRFGKIVFLDGLGFPQQAELRARLGSVGNAWKGERERLLRLAFELDSGLPETASLKTQVHTQPVGIRPEIELEPTEHPLAREQRDGIPWERVKEIASIANHHIGPPP